MREFIFPNLIKSIPKNDHLGMRCLQGMLDSHIFVTDMDNMVASEPFNPLTEVQDVSMPFKSCYLESLGDKTITFELIEDSGDRTVLWEVTSILLIEAAPGQFNGWVFGLHENKFQIRGVIFSVGEMPKSNLQAFVSDFLVRFCKQVNLCKVGYEKYHRQIPIKIGHHKYSKSISRVIRLAPEKEVTKVVPEFARTIEWDHSWFVRGHWRAHPGGIGKCRDGTYTVNGFTWVTPHVKGNKDVEPTKKIYMLRH